MVALYPRLLTKGKRLRRLGTLFCETLRDRDRTQTQTICKISIKIKSDRIS
ncbi:hypothetical protein [uncultured Nostoc sp.]|uniref:hypothetical protein n=1 Tax=uncultured Nostoc sp. TaxID=340711 RepID=UPI0035C9DA76